MTTFDAIVRVSRTNGRRGTEQFRSPQQQTDIIEREAERLRASVYWHPPALDVSGKTMDRRDLGVVLERLRAHQTDGLIVAFASRLSRARVDEALMFKAEVEDAGGRLVICDMAGIDLDTAGGEFAFTVMVAAARLQWRQTADRWETTRKDAIERGICIGPPIFGYRKENRRLVPDEKSPIVTELFERKASGHTWLELARWLDAVAPRDGLWARQTVSGIIRSRTYLGELRHGKYVNASSHTPLVSASLWRRAQNPPGHRTPRGHYLLTGLVKCKGCGMNLRGNSMGARKYRVYQCENRACTAKVTIGVKRLDEYVADQMFAKVTVVTRTSTESDTKYHEAQEDVERLTSQLELIAAVVPSHPAAVKAHQGRIAELEWSLTVAEDWVSHLDEKRCLNRELVETVWDRPLWDQSVLAQQRSWLQIWVTDVTVGKAVGRGPASDVGARVEIAWKHGLDSPN